VALEREARFAVPRSTCRVRAGRAVCLKTSTSASNDVASAPSNSAVSTQKAVTRVKVRLVQRLTTLTSVQLDTPRTRILADVKVCSLT